MTGAKTVAAVDLDGDGNQEKVRLTANGGECGSTLFAKVGDGYVSTTLDSDGPDVTSGVRGRPRQRRRQLLVTRADHPRGGFQLRIYAAAPDQLEELEPDGRALLPFVATDVQEHPWSIDCSDDGLVVTEAVAHEPPGVAAAWDIKQTTYAVDGGTVTAGPTEGDRRQRAPAGPRREVPRPRQAQRLRELPGLIRPRASSGSACR